MVGMVLQLDDLGTGCALGVGLTPCRHVEEP